MTPSPPHPAPVPDPIDVGALVAVGGFGSCEHLPEVDSTMVRARAIAADPAARLPAAVVADVQTAGQGRRGARWWQPPGSLTVSIVLDPGWAAGAEPTAPPAWSLACGVAVAETLRALEPAVEAVVRWPNDVEAGGRKLAGILVERGVGGRLVIGIGVNTTGSATDAPAAIAHRIATLPDLTGRPLGRGRLLADLLPRLRALLGGMAEDPGVLAARYRPLCGLDGHTVTVHQGTRRQVGLCRGIDASGALVLDTEAGRLHLATGSLTDPADVWRGDG